MIDRPRAEQVFKVTKDLKITKNQNVTIEGTTTTTPEALTKGQKVQVYKATTNHTHVVFRWGNRPRNTLILKVDNDVWETHFEQVHLESAAHKVAAPS